MLRRFLSLALVAMFAAAPLFAADADPARLTNGKFTYESFCAAVAKLGYNVTDRNPSRPGCTLQIDRQGTNLYPYFSVGENYIWFNVCVGDVANPERIASFVVRELLTANEQVQPAHFTYNANDKRIYLSRRFENTNWTPARLRREIDAFDALCRSYKPTWGNGRFQVCESSPADHAATVARLNGKYRLLPGSTINGTAVTAEQAAAVTITIKDGQFSANTITQVLRLVVDSTASLQTIDLLGEASCESGIFRIEGNRLILLVAQAGKPRPVSETNEGAKHNEMILERIGDA